MSERNALPCGMKREYSELALVMFARALSTDRVTIRKTVSTAFQHQHSARSMCHMCHTNSDDDTHGRRSYENRISI